MERIFYEIKAERERQDLKWGEQNHPILNEDLMVIPVVHTSLYYGIPTEEAAKRKCDQRAKEGRVTFMDILVEEVSEVASSGKDIQAMREELIQVAAVAVAMIQSLDRNGR